MAIAVGSLSRSSLFWRPKRLVRCGTFPRTMSVGSERCEALVVRLHEIQAVKFGNFKLKSGIYSPLYLDLRVIVSYPDVLSEVADVMWESIGDVGFDQMCGVPYTALPIATVMSMKHRRPMLMRRKEVKDYGTKKAIEGAYESGQSVLIVEDLVTSGASVMETVEPLRLEGLKVRHAVVLVDRQQGGGENLKKEGIELHAAFQMVYLLDVLSKRGLINNATVDSVQEFLRQNSAVPRPKECVRLPYTERASLAKCPLAKQCFEIMERKKTNLAVAADILSCEELLSLVEKIGPHICVLKTHVDVLDAWSAEIAEKLKALAEEHDFLIFEDRKFADIGNTVVQQYSGGIYKIADWAHITNAHLVPGPGIIDGLASVGVRKSRGLLLLAEMSSKGTLATGSYTQSVVDAALQHSDYVMGFISIHPAAWPGVQDNDIYRGMVHMTPGVALNEKGDSLGQQYNTPEAVIRDRGSDVIIVGRGIIKAENPTAAAIKFKEAGWKAYETCLQKEAISKSDIVC